MTAVGSNGNQPQNTLAGNHYGSLNHLGAEALDQVPPVRAGGRLGKGGNSLMLVKLATISVRAGGEPTCERDFTTRGGEISEATEKHALTGWFEDMPIVTSFEEPD